MQESDRGAVSRLAAGVADGVWPGTADRVGRPSTPAAAACVLIGAGPVLVACGDLLRSRGFEIVGVATDDALTRSWAGRNGIIVVAADDGLVAWLRQVPHDYLLSIFNLRILPPEAVRLPRIAALNYHDGPLPAYAGLHAPSWALINREPTFGVAWHLVGEGIDTGDLVAGRVFPVAADDTALSLAARCGREAVAALDGILPDLLGGTVVATPQDRSARTFYAGARRPPGAGIIDWSRPAEEIDALVRGLDFGPVANPLCRPKVWLGDRLLLAPEVGPADVAAAGPPGAVLAVDGDVVTVATASRPVSLRGLETLDGAALPTALGSATAGCSLPLPDAAMLARVTARAESLAPHERFWEHRLDELLPLRPRLGVAEEERLPAARVRLPWRMPEEVADWAARHAGTWTRRELLLVACGALVSRLGFEERFDVEFGPAPADDPGVSGFFADRVPFRFDVGGGLAEALGAVRNELGRIARHGTYARDLVTRAPRLATREGLRRRHKLPVAILMDDAGPAPDREAAGDDDGVDLVIHLPEAGTAGVVECAGWIHARLPAIAERFTGLLRDLATGGDDAPRRVSLALPEERAGPLARWGDGGLAVGATACLHHLVERQAMLAPEAIAVQDATGVITYRDLLVRARALAARLRRIGVGADVPVGICVERSIDSVVGLLGILVAGGGWVPLDPAHPPPRLEFVADDAGLRAVVGPRHLAARLPWLRVPWVDAGDDGRGDGPQSSGPDCTEDGAGGAAPSGTSLAYMIYTSGSTGRPKGVMVEHRSAAGFVLAARDRYRLGPGDRVLQFASLGFDASVEEIFPCLAAGATLVMRTDAMLGSAAVFMAGCAALRITVLDLPTAFFHLLVAQSRQDGERPAAGLRLVVIGGEQASAAHVAAWRELAGPGVELVNTYGPTEATVVATWADLAGLAGGEVPIGRPVPGAVVAVVDRWGQPLPAGVVGELRIGGTCLARGYRNLPDLTAARFGEDPAAPGRRVYRTGDLCRWREDGQLAFHGRVDDQVKIRGHRVEVAEVERALLAVPGVRRAAVLPRRGRGGDTTLAGYVEGDDVSGLGADAVRERLAAALPSFMLPATIVRLDSLPLNASGKVDRAALPDPGASPPPPRRSAAPRTPAEKMVAAEWGQVLGRTGAGVDDHFFHAGGDSLSAMELVAALRLSTGVDLTLRDVFERPSIAGLAALVEQREIAQRNAEPSGPRARAASPTAAGAAGTAPRELPATPAQQGMWLLRSILPDPATYNESLVFRTRAGMDGRRLERALAVLMERQPALRTALVPGDEGVVQRVFPAAVVAVPWSERTIPVADVATREQVIGERLLAEARRPFDLAVAPLWRAALLRTTDGESLLLLSFHHAVVDDWSLRVLIDELSEQCADEGRGHALPPPAGIEAAAVAGTLPSATQGAIDRRYWEATLRDHADGPRWPGAGSRDAVATGRGGVIHFEIDADTAGRLRLLARECETTPFTVLLAVWHVWLRLATGADDVVVGTPVADRARPETQRALGCLLNTLPVRMRWPAGGGDAADAARLRDVVATVREVFHAAVAHGGLPFHEIVRVAVTGRSGGDQPLCRVLFAYLAEPLPPLRLGGTAVGSSPVHTGTSKADLTLFVVDAAEPRCRFEYSLDVFDEPTMAGHAARFAAFVRAVAADPDERLEGLEWLPAGERELVASGWPRGEDLAVPAGGLDDLFAARAATTPDAVALSWDGGAWTYAELRARATRLARRLRSIGVAAEIPVAVAARRSPETLLVVLAILEAGGCVVPLDPALPAARLAFLAVDCGCPVIVADEGSLAVVRAAVGGGHGAESMVDGGGPRLVALADLLAEGRLVEEGPAAAGEVASPAPGGDPRRLAYVLYTSGSTGRPKGVAMPHAPLVNLVAWQMAHAAVGPGDRTLQFASLGFDVSFQEIFSTWLSGGTLELVSDEARLDPALLLAEVRRRRVARLFLPVVMLERIAEAAAAGEVFPETLREVIVAGETLRITPAIRGFFARLPRCRLWNHYGPTETHVATAHELPADPAGWPDLPPIGRPIANTRVLLLDRRMRPVPPGVAGDIWIGGAAVARGYWRRPELTAERFVADPRADGPSGRLYRTGDRGRWLPDGGIEFLGRTDHQVKIRGHRVELGEIEAALRGHPAVQAAAAVAVGDASAVRSIAAFVVRSGPGGPGSDEFVSWLRSRLPEPLVPGAVAVLPALPVNASGKVDRAALEALAAAAGTDRHGSDRGGTDDEPPLGPVEESVAAMWRELPGLGRFGRHDDFFRVGGSSLLAMRLVLAIERRFGVRLPVRAVFDHPALAALSRLIAERMPPAAVAGTGAAASPRPVPAAPAGDAVRERLVPASAGQRRLWFLEQRADGAAVYAIPVAHRIRGPVDVGRLRRSLDLLVERHEALRTSLVLVEGELRQLVAPRGAWPLECVVARGITTADREADARGILAAAGRAPFDLARGPLVRACLVRIAADEHLLLLVVHHAIADAWSLDLLHRELALCHDALAAGATPRWPSPAVADADAILAGTAHADAAGTADAEEHWRHRLAGAPPHLEIPVDKPRPRHATSRGALVVRPLGVAATARLDSLAAATGCTPAMAVAGGLAAVLGRWCGVETVVLGMAASARRQAEAADAVGFLVDTLPLRVELGGAPSFRSLLARVRAHVVDALHHALPFDRIVEIAAARRDPARSPVFQVMCAWEDDPGEPLRLAGLSVERCPFDPGVSRFDLTLVATRTPAGVELRLEYATELFEPRTADRLLGWLACLLEAAASLPDAAVCDLPLEPTAAAPAALRPDGGAAEPLPLDISLVSAFRERVRGDAAAVAVVCGSRSVSYGELDAASDRLAGALASAGVAPGGFVGVFLERSVEFVEAVLGILKAGCGYAPLPVDHPATRVAEMIADAGVTAIVADRGLSGRLPPTSVPRIPADADAAWRSGSVASPPVAAVPGGEAPAYVMYTSGSTGGPKGVVVPQRAVVRLVHGQSYADFGPGLRTLLLAPTAFDASTFEVWAPLLSGGACVVFPDRLPDIARLREVLREGAVNCLWLTAGLFNLVVDTAPDVLATVAHVITGGESLSVPHVRRAFAAVPGLRLTNGYGPTESTTFATTHPIDAADAFPRGSVPIGRPLVHTTCQVVDAALRPVPAGIPGELVVGGAGLALGYLGRPELTAERFVTIPAGDGSTSRVYRTGDLCRKLEDGSLEFLGRTDGQVKIRGHRVEPGEIESALERHPDVARAVVVVVTRPLPGGQAANVLRACVVPRDGAPLDGGRLREFLAALVPEPMLPTDWVSCDALPLTANGKVDRAAVRELPTAGPPGAATEAVGETCRAAGGGAEAGSPLAAEILGIWRRLFGRDDLGLNDEFFAVGGHSLLAARLAIELEDLLGRRVPIATVFEYPTVAALARTLGDVPGDARWRAVVPLAPRESGAPLFLVHGLGGDVFHFVGMARLLPEDVPVYGIHSRDRPGPYPETLEELAAEYAAEIRTVAPAGPYLVGGYSIGGWVAFEVARQLRVHGADVTLLLFDTHPLVGVPWPARGVQKLHAVVAEAADIVARMRLHARSLIRLPLRGAVSRAVSLPRSLVRRVARVLGWASFDRAAAARAAAARGESLESTDPIWPLVERYRPEAPDFAVELLVVSMPVSRVLPWFWRLLVGPRLTTRVLPGDHYRIFAAEGLPDTAAAVTRALRRSRPAMSAGGS